MNTQLSAQVEQGNHR